MVWQVLAAEGAKAVAEASKGTNQSGGGFYDARSMFDGSGWTVSTGRSAATGGTSGSTGAMSGAQLPTDPASTSFADPIGNGWGFSAGGLVPLLLVALLAVTLARRRKG